MVGSWEGCADPRTMGPCFHKIIQVNWSLLETGNKKKKSGKTVRSENSFCSWQVQCWVKKPHTHLLQRTLIILSPPSEGSHV